ncbi:PAS domain-containing protein [Hymenobacter crusticola]|uniref:histidine kinase n=1 Tax=Hymenobacter crusticola TaxID=1770526 RepID=A0A243WG64_9BACT|nr:PAS domain-containing protein [Hymenobacter crusticola]OUJ74744.1 hypothetical protein BXP70_08275 [Hymenobacter crusticola]
MPTLPLPERSVALLDTLLDISLTAVALLRPLYSDDNRLTDFAWVYLNPAGQQMLRQPEVPTASLLTLFPTAVEDGVFAKCRQAFLTGEAQRNETLYQADGLDGYFLLTTQRSGDLLVVNFTDTNYHPRTPVEQALRASQAREREAQAETERLNQELTVAVQVAERERAQLQALLTQAPVGIALFQGEAVRVAAVNERMAALWGRTPEQVLGQALLEGVPELRGQGFDEMIRAVLHTREAYIGTEAPAFILQDGEMVARYYNFVCQPIYDSQGELLGVVNVGTEVTEQVEARRQLEQLTQQLDARVQERTQQLAQQTHRLARLVQEAPAAIALLDGPELVFQLLNANYQALFPDRALLGRPVREALPELLHTRLGEVLRNVYQTGVTFEGYEFPIPFAGPDGQPQARYFDFIYQARYDESGAIDGLVLFGFDETERVLRRQHTEALQAQLLAAAEQRARQRQDLYRIFEQDPAAIVLLREPDHQIDYFNPTFAGLFPGESLRGRTVAAAYPDAFGRGVMGRLDHVYQTGETRQGLEVALPVAPHPDRPQQQRYFNFTYQAYREQNRIVGVAVFLYEVTELVQARQAVEAGRRQLQLVTDALPVLIGYLDRERRYQFANEAYRGWFHRAPSTLLGQPVRAIVGDAAYAATSGYMEQALAGERVDFEATMRYRADFTKHIRTSYIPDVHDGAVVGFYTLVLDVTDQVEARQRVEESRQQTEALAAELQQVNAQLLRTNADLDTFVYTASHDLKAPLTNLEGLLAVLQEETAAGHWNDTARHVLRLMQEAVGRFRATLGYLTEITHLLPGTETEPLDAAEVTSIVTDVELDLAPLVAAARAQVTVDVAECPAVRVPAKTLRAVVYNLLSNALKYCAPDRVPTVHLRCWCEAQEAKLAVRDNGLGMDLTRQTELFSLFRRYHPHVEGAGVGLYMVKRMVEHAGGRIEVRSQPGEGSTFTVTFPHPGQECS